MQRENQFIDIYEALLSGNAILMDIDGYLSLSVSALNPTSIQIIDHYACQWETSKTFLVSSLEMLKKYHYRLHPRIETLLVYFKRPMNIQAKQLRGFPHYFDLNNTNYYFRIVNDHSFRRVIDKLATPLYSICLSSEVKQSNFTKLDPRISISKTKSENNNPNLPLLQIEYDEEGLIDVKSL